MTVPHPHTTRSGHGLRVPRAAVFAAVCVVLAGAGHTLASHAVVPLWALGAGFVGTLLTALPLTGRVRSLPGVAALLAVGETVLHTVFGIGQHGTTATTSASSAGTGAGSDASLIEQAARLVCGAGGALLSPAQAQRILTEARISPGTTGTQNTADGTRTGYAREGALPVTSGLSAADSAMSLLPSLPMLLVHVFAALATGWLLRRGDLALLRLAEPSAYGVAGGSPVRFLRTVFALVLALRAGLPGVSGVVPRRLCPVGSMPHTPRISVLQHTVVRRGPPPPGTTLALAA